MDHAVPPIPPRPKSAHASQTKADGTRRHTYHPTGASSSASSSAAAAAAAAAADHHHHRPHRNVGHPSSPEVISSLISSLSTISTPAETLFDSLLPSAAETALPPSPAKSTISGHVRDVQTADGVTVPDFPGQLYLHPSEAAIPPVVRTAKPPSGLSPLTATKKFSAGRNGRRRWSPPSPLLLDSQGSIGTISVEPSPVLHSATSVRSFGSAKSKGGQALSLKTSKERVREIDKERKRKSVKSLVEKRSKSPLRGPATGGDPPRGSSLPAKHFGDTIGHLVPVEIPPRARSVAPSFDSDKTGATAGEDSLASSAVRREIPTRESSLRHSTGSTPPRRKKKSKPETVLEVDTTPPPMAKAPATAQPLSGGEPDLQGEDGALKRIRELKARKQERERSFSDDEDTKRREKERRKRWNRAHSSLPAPSLESASLSRGALPADDDPGKENRRPMDLDPTSETRDLDFEPSPSPLIQSSALGGQNPRSFSTSAIPEKTAKIEEERPTTADTVDDAVDAFMAAERLSRKIIDARTGRTICFSDVGDINGSVVMCCLGMGTTRYLTAFYDELAVTLKIRLIALDRPGIGDSEPYDDGSDTPLGWPDDVLAVCQALNVSRFSVLAHSAGAIYALALALRMPQHIRGRIHLLAPWIPPSQMVAIGIHQDPAPATNLPYTQRILRSLPTPLLRAANSNFFSLKSSSITSLPKSPRRTKRRSLNADTFDINANSARRASQSFRRASQSFKRASVQLESLPAGMMKGSSAAGAAATSNNNNNISGSVAGAAAASRRRSGATMTRADLADDRERQSEYDSRLTQAIWEAATTGANPAVDLLVCLERRQEIGFRYVDIAKAVVMHHGSRDTRVPVENVRWLGRTMRRCEVRVLEGEGHGLMASAAVMGRVLGEIAKEWDDWNAVVQGKRAEKRA